MICDLPVQGKDEWGKKFLFQLVLKWLRKVKTLTEILAWQPDL